MQASVRALLQKPFTRYLHSDERFAMPGFQPAPNDELRRVDGGWEFDTVGTGFQSALRIEFDNVPEEGQPVPFG